MKQEMTLTERLKQVQGALKELRHWSHWANEKIFGFSQEPLFTEWGNATKALALMPSIIAEVERLSERQDQLQYIAKSLHYPECWDTMAYPTIWDAIIEMAACSECSDGKQSKLTAEPTEGEVEAVAAVIHQCHYHPVDWGSKEWRNMFEREKPLAISMAKAAIKEFMRLRHE